MTRHYLQQTVRRLKALLTRGASGYSSLLGNLYVTVSVDRQNPHLEFKTLQYQNIWASCDMLKKNIVSAHSRILGMASVVCVLVKICVSSISLYKLDTDKLTAPFESAHQFTLVCTVSDSKTVPGCHYNLCSNHSFVLTD